MSSVCEDHGTSVAIGFRVMAQLKFKLILMILLSSVSTLAADNFCRELFSTPQVAMMATHQGHPSLPLGMSLTDFPENTAARIYVEYAAQHLLLQQDESDLSDLGLIVPNGGLCASASITNVIGSMMAQEHNFKLVYNVAPRAAQKILGWYRQVTGRDGRLGANVAILADIVVSYWQNLLEIYQFTNPLNTISTSTAVYHHEFFPYRMAQYLRGDSIGLLTVTPIEGEYVGLHNFHAVVLLKVDLERNRLILSDPNNPNQIIAAPFEYTQGTDIVFRVPFTLDGDRVRIVSLQVFTRKIHNFL